MAASSKPQNRGRRLSAYNQYMKDQLPQYKAEHPDVAHVDAFRAVAKMWKDCAQNPRSAQNGPEEVVSDG
ncbi:hypothetical protein BDV25DRAFT_141351 [Aspergillus avenaceus]|uniref:YABBY protein C-terminal domain-containing protein n=1 Tax=Aspergillus avenaceus TaxID=36643 RepID=A0A5N6TR81_ASPAV|nr:hypothetical protein BDV25DRAFT_141351 [Aspergillus avenaceus]